MTTTTTTTSTTSDGPRSFRVRSSSGHPLSLFLPTACLFWVSLRLGVSFGRSRVHARSVVSPRKLRAFFLRYSVRESSEAFV